MDEMTESKNKDVKGEGSGILIPKINPDGQKNSDSPVLKKPEKEVKSKRSRKKIALATLGVLFLIILIIVAVTGVFGYRVYKKGLVVKTSFENLTSSTETQDLEKIKSELQNTKQSLSDFKTTYNSISWMKVVPFLGLYVSDGDHALNAADYGIEAAEIVIETIEPYADIIGFTSESQDAESPDETTQDRIDFVIKTIPDVIPKADLIWG